MNEASVTLGLIPARGGSKGVARKNLRILGGRPLLQWTVEAALAARALDAVVLSSEDEEILALGEKLGVRTMRRPAELATDVAQNEGVLADAVTRFEADGRRAGTLVLLQPTSPLRTAGQIDAAVAFYREQRASSVVSACEVEHHPGKCLRVRGGLAEPYASRGEFDRRRQELEPVYRQNGAIYVVARDAFMQERRVFLPPCRIYLMDRASSVEIDDETDFELARAFLDAASRDTARDDESFPGSRHPRSRQ